MVGAFFLEAGTVDAWKAPVSQRAYDAAKSWGANGDVDHESEEANKAILQTTVTFLELTTRMVSDPHVKRVAHWQDATVASHRIVFSRQPSALVASFLDHARSTFDVRTDLTRIAGKAIRTLSLGTVAVPEE